MSQNETRELNDVGSIEPVTPASCQVNLTTFSTDPGVKNLQAGTFWSTNMDSPLVTHLIKQDLKKNAESC